MFQSFTSAVEWPTWGSMVNGYYVPIPAPLGEWSPLPAAHSVCSRDAFTLLDAGGVLVLAVASTWALHPTAVLHPGPISTTLGCQQPGPLGQPKGEC